MRLTGVDREMLGLAVPALGALIAEPLYVLADTAVVGNIGTAELGGLGLASQIIGTVISISIFLAYGTTSAVGRLLGAGRATEAARQAVQGLWIAVALGIVCGIACWVWATPMLEWLQGEPDVVANGRRYLRISVFGLPAMLLVLAGVGYLRGLKDTRRPLIIAAVAAVGNLLLELFLVFGLGYGIGASALSTVVFQWISAAAYLGWIGAAARAEGVNLRPHLQSLGRLGREGIDLFVRTTALRASLIAAAAYAASLGKASLGAHEIGFAIFFVIALALDAVAIAAQAMVATLVGAGDRDQAQAVGRRLTWWGLVLGVGAAVVIAALSPVLPDLFSDDGAVIERALPVLLLLALMQPLAGLTFALDGILIGAADMRYLAKAMVISAIGFAAMLWLVIRFDGGLVALWLALIGFMALRGVTLVARIRGSAWLDAAPVIADG